MTFEQGALKSPGGGGVWHVRCWGTRSLVRGFFSEAHCCSSLWAVGCARLDKMSLVTLWKALPLVRLSFAEGQWNNRFIRFKMLSLAPKVIFCVLKCCLGKFRGIIPVFVMWTWPHCGDLYMHGQIVEIPRVYKPSTACLSNGHLFMQARWSTGDDHVGI